LKKKNEVKKYLYLGNNMLELIGLLTIIYIGIKVFPSVLKFTVKLAVAILIIILGVLTYFYFFPPTMQILIAFKSGLMFGGIT
tara:strand:- start:830 stop:1078 length:249 start_codon:yes stop_codon:yes gene_type:complete